jgi:hypothetical protein
MKSLHLANQRVSAGQVSIQSQGPLEFSDALNCAVGEAQYHAQAKMSEGILWSQRKRLRRSRFRRREARSPVVCEEAVRPSKEIDREKGSGPSVRPNLHDA